MNTPLNVLFLCTGNSARSIMAESLLTELGRGNFRAFSAGSFPKGAVRPEAIAVLKEHELPTEGLRSKPWDEFATPDAPVMDFVFTVCDQAANEPCPVWPGQPVTAHWGVPDPAAVDGSETVIMLAFRDVFRMIETRLKLFTALPLSKLSSVAIQRKVDEIGRVRRDNAEGSRVMTITIYHNPDCGTSRNVLALIRNSGEEPTVIEYLKTPPSRAELVDLIAQLGISVRNLLRQKGTPYDALGLDDSGLTDEALLDAMMAHPILINRPIVITPLGVKLCRPSEAVLDILPDPQRAAFAKEDGEQVVDARGHRVA